MGADVVKMKDFAKAAIKPFKGKSAVLPPQLKTEIKAASGGGGSGKISWKTEKGNKYL